MRLESRIVALAFALLLVPCTARAYTLVLRNGTRVEIGNAYQLVGSRLEYRDAGGSARAMSLGDVDVDATARANSESVTAFVDRASRGTAPAVMPVATPVLPQVVRVREPESGAAPLTITSQDLEPLRAAREQSDAAYDSLHPNARTARNDDTAVNLGPQFTPEEEDRWRAAAQELLDQLEIEQTQIDAIRSEIEFRQANPFNFRLSYRYNYGNAPVFRQADGRFVAPYGNPAGYLRADEEFAQLNSRLIDLQIQHQGTQAAWDNFAERARRRGVPPGWLRQ